MYPKRLGPYDLEEPLGKGGMGTVYRAFHRDTGEKAAVKALAPRLAETEGFRDRFESEIESLKLLRHPGIVRLLGYGEEDGLLFYAMELVEGTSLEEELRAGRRFTWREVTDYGIQICRALKHAHDHGVIHRDVKPANLLINAEGRVKIADFGIARLFGSTQLTSAGGVLGTADYMPPEQIDGRNVTDRCDQYSLGGVMYALLAGRPPFRAKSLPEMLQLQRFAEPEPVRRYAPDTPEQLERLIMQLLSKDPANRFPNTLVLARHMEAMQRALSRPAADDFALSAESSEPVGPSDPSYEAVGMDTTRIEPEIAMDVPARDRSRGSVSATQSAARKATVRGAEPTGPMTVRRESGDDLELEPPVPRSRPESPKDSRPPAARPANRFRTVDEDLLEDQDTHRTPRWLFAVQVAGLVGALALIAAAIWHFSRPLTADDLYAQIDEEAAEGRTDALRTVERQIEEFLRRFPKDPRAAAVKRHHEEIELSRREASIHKRARRRLGGQALAPIEQLYLEAIRKADTNPTEAIRDLQSILVLYQNEPGPGGPATGPTGGRRHASENPAQPSSGPTDSAEPMAPEADTPEARELNRRVQDCLLLIQRRLAQLTHYTEMEAANQLPVLHRRLDAAHALRSTDPDGARRLYKAIVNLCEGKQWARDVVEEATAALAKMDAANLGTQEQGTRDRKQGTADGG